MCAKRLKNQDSEHDGKYPDPQNSPRMKLLEAFSSRPVNIVVKNHITCSLLLPLQADTFLILKGTL